MSGQNRFSVGSGDPWNSQEAVRQLMARFYELSQRLTHFSVTLQKISNIAMVVEQMFGRVSAGLMLMFGLPRIMRSDLYRSVVSSGRFGGRGFNQGPPGSVSSGGPGGGGGDYPKTREEWLNYYKMKAEARKQAEEESGIKYKRWDVDEAKKVSEQKLEIFEHEQVRKKAILEKYWRSQPKKTKEDYEDEAEAKKIAEVKTQISEQEDIVAKKQKNLGTRTLPEQIKAKDDYEKEIKIYRELADMETDPNAKNQYIADIQNLDKQLKIILTNIQDFADLDQAIDKVQELKDVLKKLTDISPDEIYKKIDRFEKIKSEALAAKEQFEKVEDYYSVAQQEDIIKKSDAAIEELKKHQNYQPPTTLIVTPLPKDPSPLVSDQNKSTYQIKDNWQSSSTSKGFFADLHEEKLGKFLSTLPKGSNYKRHLKEGTLNIFWKGFTENFKIIIEKFVDHFNKNIIQTFSGSKIGKFLIPKIKTFAAVSIIGAGVLSELYSIISSKVKNVFSTIFGKISWIIKDSLDFIGKSNLFKFAQIKGLGALRVLDPVIKKVGGFFGGPPKTPDPNLGNYSGESGGINKIVEKFTGIITKVSTLFLGLAAAAQGLIKAASPDLFSTFTMSIQLLAAKVGAVLIPTFVDLSRWIQKTAFWFDSWSSGSKAALGTLLDWTLKISGSILAIGLLGKALSTLATTSGRVGLALGLTAILLGRINDGIDEDKKKNRAAIDQARPLMQPEAYKRLRELVPEIDKNITPREKYEAIDRSLKVKTLGELSAQKQFKEAQDNASSISGTLGEFQRYLFGGNLSGIDYQEEVRNKFSNLAKVISDKKILEQAKFNILSEGKIGNIGSALSPKVRAEKSQELLMHIQSQKVTPRYQGVEEAYKNIQIEALGKSPLEMILEKTVAENLRKTIEILREELGHTERISGYLEKAVNK